MKNFSFIFLLGRPGCGKSLIFNILTERFLELGVCSSTERIDDFPILRDILSQDAGFKRHVLKDGGFEITDFTIVDEVLGKINGLLKEKKKTDKKIFVEFARDDYGSAMKNFSEDVLGDSIILYVFCPYEECLKRNISRYKNRVEEDDDSHIVPVDLMETYYKKDDYEEKLLSSRALLFSDAPAPLFVVSTETGDVGILRSNLEEFLEKLKGGGG